MISFSKGKRLLLDGATGTNMLEAGMPQGACTEQWILENPAALRTLQKAYAYTGCDVVYAPTFGANRAALARHGLGDRVEEYNAALVALTREAVGSSVAVAGDMSPSSLFMEPAGDATFQDLYELYAQQAKALAAAGVDCIAIETMMSLSEARIALLAAKEVTSLPVLVTMTMEPSGRTLSGNGPLCCLAVLQALGADAFGFNCSTGPAEMLELFRAIAPYAKIPLIAKPNAGMPKIVDGKTLFDYSPALLADESAKLLAEGVSVLGGCCGTTPRHMAALRAVLDQAPPCAALEEPAVLLAATQREAMFISPLTDISPQIFCTENLAEDILEMEDEYSVINIAFKSLEDVEIFAENDYMLNSPLAISAPTKDILEAAARRFCGIALYDSSDSIEDDIDQPELEKIIRKYGLIQL